MATITPARAMAPSRPMPAITNQRSATFTMNSEPSPRPPL
jgi:hypothetical protein